jgi:hypothetical protein
MAYGLAVFDLSDPNMPVVLSHCYVSGQAPTSLRVLNATAFLTQGQDGVSILDVSDPRHPKFLANVRVPGSARRVELSDRFAFIADSDSGIVIVDYSDPQHPILAEHRDCTDPINDLVLRDTLLWAVGRGLLAVFEARNAPDLHEVVRYDSHTYHGSHILLRDSLAYISASDALHIWNIKNLFDAAELSYWPNGPYQYLGFIESFLMGDTLVSANDYNGIKLLDISDPTHPVLLGSLRRTWSVLGIDGFSRRAYLAGYTCMQTIDLSNARAPSVISSIFGQGYRAGVDYLWVSDTLAVVGNDRCGLQLLDLTNAAEPRWISNRMLPHGVLELSVIGKYAYAVHEGTQPGLFVCDLTDTAAPLLDIPYAEVAYNVSIGWPYAFVARDKAGFDVLDISDPGNPALITNYDTPGDVHDVRLRDTLLFVADGFGVRILNCSDPLSIQEVGYWSGITRNLEMWDNYLISLGNYEFTILDISNPAVPQVVSSYYTGGWLIRAFVRGSEAFVNDRTNGTLCFDVSDPAAPTLIGCLPSKGVPEELQVRGDYLYLTDGLALSTYRIEDVNSLQENLPSTYALSQNVPNPFNGSTRIEFSLARAGDVTLDVFDVLGRKVCVLTRAELPSGAHTVIWDGRNEEGRAMSSGVYFYRLSLPDHAEAKAMLLLK